MDIVSSRSLVTRAVGVAAGQADGIQPRTIEVLQVRWRGYGGRNVRLTVPQSYGLAEPLIRIGAHFPRAVRSPSHCSLLRCHLYIALVLLEPRT